MAPPPLDKRRGEPGIEKLHAETMYVREYERGRVVRNTPIQRPEVIGMLSSLIGETQAVAKRSKVCMPAPPVQHMHNVTTGRMHMHVHVAEPLAHACAV